MEIPVKLTQKILNVQTIESEIEIKKNRAQRLEARALRQGNVDEVQKIIENKKANQLSLNL